MKKEIEVKNEIPPETLEKVLISGDLSALSPKERVSYYMTLCKILKLNPLVKPFEYSNYNGKLVLYALRGCTDQLREIRGINVEEISSKEESGLYVVTAKIRDKKGRTEISTGVVNIENLKGDARANAIMKAETKAKRRATLSICGLSMMDETELETVPQAKPRPDIPTVETPPEQEKIPGTSRAEFEKAKLHLWLSAGKFFHGKKDMFIQWLESHTAKKINELTPDDLLTAQKQIDEWILRDEKTKKLVLENQRSFLEEGEKKEE